MASKSKAIIALGKPKGKVGAPPIHGAAGANKDIAAGRSFAGVLAQEMERAVQVELVQNGLAAVVESRAVKMQCVSDLYYQAFLSTPRKNLKKVDYYMRQFCKLQTGANKAWALVAALQREAKGDQTDIIEAAMASAREAMEE